MALFQTSAAPRVHYAWVIVAIALLVVFAALGLARFSFGMLLPAIAEDLGLNYRQQGFLSATYFAGYLAIVFVLPWLAPRLGPRLLCGGGLAVTALAMFVMSAGFAYPVVASSYFIAGLGSAAAFVGAMSLPSFWFYPSHRARGAGVAVAGAGVGILFSGLLVPRVTDGLTVAPWQLIWTGFAALTLVVSLLALWYLRNRPAALGLAPFGRVQAANAGLAGAAERGGFTSRRVWAILVRLGAVYFFFGITCLSYTTFIVTTMVDDRGLTVSTAGLLWAIVGGLSILSGGLFGNISDRFGHRVGMVAALLTQAAAFALVTVDAGLIGLYLSITLFGLSAWSMPTIISAAAGDYLGAERAAAGFAILTLMFAAGQAVGPAATGWLAQWSGNFSIGYGMLVVCNLVAGALAVGVRRQAP